MGNHSNIINTINDYLYGYLNDNKCKHLFVYITIISILELFAYKMQGIFSVVSSRIWLLGGLFCFISIICYFVHSVISDLKEKKYLSVIALFLLVLSLIIIIGHVNYTEINPDAAQQAAAGMDSFHNSDLNYTEKAFLGYPSRQYIITAIPAFLFGRSIATLQLGFAIPFILGILLLYCGLRKWAQKLNINTSLAVLPLFALFVFPFVTEYYINFEQAIYPISFTMIAIGFFLIIMCEPNMAALIGLAWTGCLFSNSYTPVLATLGLLIVLIAISSYLWRKKPNQMPFPIHNPGIAAKAFLAVEGNMIVFFVATLLSKRQDRITQVRTDVDLFSVSYQSIFEFLTDKNAKFLGMFGMVVIIYIFAGLTKQLKVRDVLLSLWILGVFVATNLLTGYTTYQPAWIMQRALIIIPVVLVGVTLTAFDMISRYKVEIKHGIVAVLLISLAFIGLNNSQQRNQSFTYFNFIQPVKYMLCDLEKSVKDNGESSSSEFNLVLYTDNALMKNPADYCKFFFPNANVYIPEYGELPADIDLSLKTFVYSDKEYNGESPVKEDDIITFTNKRYDMTVRWYKGSIMNE